MGLIERLRDEADLCRNEGADDIARLLDEACAALAAPTDRAEPLTEEQIGEALHYPECWDTAAYPTVLSALSEVFAFFRCSNDEHATALTETQEDAPTIPPMGQTSVLSQESAQSSADARDAARYRWLRGSRYTKFYKGEGLDAAIDAAMSAEHGEQKP